MQWTSLCFADCVSSQLTRLVQSCWMPGPGKASGCSSLEPSFCVKCRNASYTRTLLWLTLQTIACKTSHPPKLFTENLTANFFPEFQLHNFKLVWTARRARNPETDKPNRAGFLGFIALRGYRVSCLFSCASFHIWNISQGWLGFPASTFQQNSQQ